MDEGSIDWVLGGEAVDTVLRGGGVGPPLSVEGAGSLEELVEEALMVAGAAEEGPRGQLRYGAALLLAFVQHNLTGPPLSPCLVLCSEPVGRAAAEALGAGGERVASSAGALVLLVVARAVLFDSTLDMVGPPVWLWRARWYAQHRQLLPGRLPPDSELLCLLRAPPSPSLLLERVRCLIAAERFPEARISLADAMQQAGLVGVHLTGIMGRRTKYQTFDVAQLVLHVEETTLGPSTEVEREQVAEVGHEEDNPLREKPLLNTATGAVELPPLTAHQQCVLLVACVLAAKEEAHDEQTVVLALPWANAVLEQHRHWTVHSAALFVRSLLEAQWSKTRDRAALQLQVLLDQWADGDGLAASDVGTMHRLEHVFTSPMPPRYVLQVETARAYTRIGAASSAAALYAAVGMQRQRVSCLVMSGQSAEASAVVRDLLVKAEGAERWELLCLQGDVEGKPDYWEQAWTESAGKCPLAMRMAGRARAAVGDWEGAAERLAKALEVNSAHPESQFTLGTALMHLGRFKEAIAPLAAAAHQLTEDGQAWANLAAALQACNQSGPALTAAQQAARHRPRDHRILENLMALGRLEGQLSVVVHAATRLCELRHESKPERMPRGALVAVLESPVDQALPPHTRELFDQVVEGWAALPDPYLMRARLHARQNRPRDALLDAARATRLLKAALAADPDSATARQMMVAHLPDHARWCREVGSDEDQRALASLIGKLAETVLSGEPEAIGKAREALVRGSE